MTHPSPRRKPGPLPGTKPSADSDPGFRRGDGLVARLFILAARGWQMGPSRVLPPSCRFAPSCSAYAIEAIGRYGALKGGWLSVRRLARCQPWGGHGYDPVP